MKIYLAGPMDIVSKEDMCGWRKECHEYFDSIEGVELLDPTMRPHECALNEKEIFLLDLKDIDNSDVILTDTRAGKPQFGTPCEVFYASYILKKPVIGWYTEECSPVNNVRIFQKVLFTNEFNSLEGALEHIHEYYT